MAARPWNRPTKGFRHLGNFKILPILPYYNLISKLNSFWINSWNLVRFLYFDIPKMFLFFIVEIKRIPETTGLDPVVIVNSMFSTFGHLCRARIPARYDLSQPENERFLSDRSVDGIGSIRSSFSSFSLSSPSCWTFPQLSTIVPLSAYPSQMVVRYSLQCRSSFRTRPSRTNRFRPVPGHKNQLTLCRFQNGSKFG